MLNPLSLAQLVSLESTRTVVLTVNNRFARRVLLQLQQQLLHNKHQQTLALPAIMPLSAWLLQANDDLSFNESVAPASYLLDGFSSAHLWEQVILEQEPEAAWLLDVPQAAKLAADADALIDEWHLTIPADTELGDVLKFQQWREAYKAHLHSHDLDDQNQATQRVVHAIAQGHYVPDYNHVVLVGFQELSARLQCLLQGLEQQGITLYALEEAGIEQPHCERIEAPAPDAEWRLAAQWAVKQLREKPAGRFAIVAPDLQNEAAFAHRVLAHELEGFSWNIAVARPLSEWPLVRAALAWLRVLAEYSQGLVRSRHLGEALLAGYCVGMDTEQNQRVVLEVALRHGQQRYVAREYIEKNLATCELLADAWQQVQVYLAQLPAQFTPAQGVDHVRELLMRLGFPGEVPLDSHAYQTMQALDQRLGQFARLAPVFGALNLPTLVQLLRRYLQETLFQPQREASARLDVLGLLEAEGGHWDAIWVLGMTDDVLPAVAAPNPFIPYEVLRQANAPRATPERELEWAKTALATLMRSASEVIFSHAAQDNGKLLRPSPLIVDLPMSTREDPLPMAEEGAMPLEQVLMEQLLDEQGPPVAAGEKVYGGTGLLDKQARNPLWAFVQHRLHAQALTAYEDSGLMRLQRGLFVHEVLERFYQRISPRTQEQLQRLWKNGASQQLLQQAIEQAAQNHLRGISETIKRLEMERAEIVLSTWIAFDAQRPSFTIEALEQKHQLSGLNTDLRIDRIDRLDSGEYVLIDYKTGNPKSNTGYKEWWLRPRAIELQLPIYAAILAEQGKSVAGLGFACTHYQSSLIGYGDEGTGLSNPEPEGWEAFISRLEAQILARRDEFLAGYAANCVVDDKDLHYCDVSAFLRLNQEAMDD